MKLRISGLMLAAFAAAAVAFACGGDDQEPTPPSTAGVRIQVLTSLELFADFAREVGGDRVEVWPLVPTTADLQAFRPTQEDIDHIQRAHVILINSYSMEASILDVINEHRRGASQLVRFALNVPSPTEAEPGAIEPTAEEVGDNPHLWLDLNAAKIYVDSVADSLAIVDGAQSDFYEDNARAYKAVLDDLAAVLKEKIDAIPMGHRKIVTLHDSFPHFARYFGLEVLGVVQPDPDREPSAEEISRLSETIQKEEMEAIFQDPGPKTPVMEQLSRETGTRLCTLRSDSLDEDVPTYVELMRSNVEELLRCL